MNETERLMSEYPELDFRMEPAMPDCQKGLIYEDVVYLNPRQSHSELAETVAEEIAHYLTSVGDIIDQSDIQNHKQEQRARDIGAFLLVSPQKIVDCYEEGCKSVNECACHLGISAETMEKAITWYSRKWDGIYTAEGYTIYFYPDGKLGVFKSLE